MNTASPDDIDISVIWHSLRRSVPKLLALSLAAGIAAYIILSLVKPEYSSEAQIQLVAPKREVQANDAASAEAVAADSGDAWNVGPYDHEALIARLQAPA